MANDIDPGLMKLLLGVGRSFLTQPSGAEALATAAPFGAQKIEADVMQAAQQKLNKRQRDLVSKYLDILAGEGVQRSIDLGTDNQVGLKVRQAPGFESDEEQMSIGQPALAAPAEERPETTADERLSELLPLLSGLTGTDELNLSGLTPEQIQAVAQQERGIEQMRGQILGNVFQLLQSRREAQQRVPVEFEEGTLLLTPSEASKFWTRKGEGEEPPSNEIEFFLDDPEGYRNYLEAKADDGNERAETELEFWQRNPEGYAQFKQAQAQSRQQKEKTPTPISWGKAVNELNSRFGELEKTGQWSITAELQGMHRVASKKLAEYRREGELSPLESVNAAEDFAKKTERRFWESIDRYKGDEEKIAEIENTFFNLYGYVPRRRPTDIPESEEEQGFFGNILRSFTE